MSLRRNILRDKKLEPFFLDYTKYVYLLHFEPRTGDLIKELEIINGFDISLNRLNEKIFDLYGVANSFEDCSDPVNQIIIEAVESYIEKYPIEKILRRPTTHIKNLATQEFFKSMGKDLNTCGICGNPKHEINFDQLPDEAIKGFEDFKDEAVILYCMKCNEYNLIMS
jgi:hypothetical protein